MGRVSQGHLVSVGKGLHCNDVINCDRRGNDVIMNYLCRAV